MEEEFKPRICIICFHVTSDENCTAIEESVVNALDALLLKLPVDEGNNSTICNTCCTKVLEAFRFKAVCMDTEESIVHHLNSKNETPVPLNEIYLTRNGKEQLINISEEERICRLCMQIAIYGFTSVRDIETDIFRIYIPEVNFNYTEDPVLCTTCVMSLKTHSEFLTNCFDLLKLETISKDEPTEDPFHIKTEEIEIKSEESIEDTEIHLVPNKLGVCKTKGKDSAKTRLSEAGNHQCNMCSYQSKKRGNLMRHQLKHKKLSEVPTYKCGVCDYISKRKDCLVFHELKHKDISEVKMYKCDTCNFETRVKEILTRHVLTHKDSSEVEMYKCGKCNYEAKYKWYLVKHQLIHKDISEVQMYKCHICSYNTKFKGNFVKHQLIHQDISEVKMYKCATCNYKSKRKRNLVVHQSRHKNISEVQMYKCETCNFETKFKKTLARHSLVHIDNPELQMFKCHACSYKTKFKGTFIKHQLIHKDIPKVQMYKCGTCDFESKYERCLTRHTLRYRHLPCANVQVYAISKQKNDSL